MHENISLAKKIGDQLHNMAQEHSLFNVTLLQMEAILKTIGENISTTVFDLKSLFSEFNLQLHSHFREEEHLLYSLMQNLPTSLIEPEILESMIHQIANEHTMIRKLIAQIEELLVKEHSDLHWLTASMDSFMDFMRAHGRKENTVISHLQQILTGEVPNYSSDAVDIAAGE